MSEWTITISVFGEPGQEIEVSAMSLGDALQQALEIEGVTENDEGSYTITVSGG